MIRILLSVGIGFVVVSTITAAVAAISLALNYFLAVFAPTLGKEGSQVVAMFLFSWIILSAAFWALNPRIRGS